MDARQQRVGKNEALFREVNERIKEINRGMGFEEEVDFICECGDDGCAKPVTLTLRDYEEVRSNPARFLIVPGHQAVEVEAVVAENERFAVIEKHPGPPTDLAAGHDPRS